MRHIAAERLEAAKSICLRLKNGAGEEHRLNKTLADTVLALKRVLGWHTDPPGVGVRGCCNFIHNDQVTFFYDAG
jgi:hypothetical protein